MRIAFGLSMDGSTYPPKVDGEELTDLEWQVWLAAFGRSGMLAASDADMAVRLFRIHFRPREQESADDDG